MSSSPTRLPIDELLAPIADALHASNRLVIEAPPGAGKTTRVPASLLDAGFGEVIVLQPRRIAARMAARRVAEERGERVGETVGYQVRFEQFAGPRTRLRFLTEGVLTRRLLSEPDLAGVGVVVLDEFHERHLEGDLALALLRRLQQRRPELRLIVMSATLAGRSVADALGGCPVLRSEGRLYPLEIAYTPESSETPEQRVVQAAERLIKEQREGDILVFLPGAAEIRRAQRALAHLASRHDLLLAPLHGDLTPEEQDAAVLPNARRKIILATNVAESSITIEGVRAVIDSGLHRVAKDSVWTGLPRVEIQRVARASATQRAGRAGRTAPGRVIRLYTEDDFLRRPEYDAPEITRRELGGLCLDLHAAGAASAAELEWLDAPPVEALEQAETLLHRLRALDSIGHITKLGMRMAALPLPPRLAALALDGGEAGCIAAAALSTGERLPEEATHEMQNDLDLFVERRAESRRKQVEQQLKRIVNPRASGKGDALRRALLRAFPDRVARRLRNDELKLVGGVTVKQAANSAVRKAQLMVAVEVEERPEQGAPLARLLCAIEPEWLIDEFPDRVTERDTCVWNRAIERVERSSALVYDDLIFEESRGGTPDAEQAAALLAHQAVEAGLHRFTDVEALNELRARVAFASEHSTLAPLDDAHIEAALRAACLGLYSLREVEQTLAGGAFERALIDSLGKGASRQLNELAPDKIRLPSGRNARVHYAVGQTPWVASRLQDFFGLKETPRIARGTVSLVVHLLAPSQRPVQTTQDLAGFWQRLYPQLRKELSRRYPRHAWPENPDLPTSHPIK